MLIQDLFELVIPFKSKVFLFGKVLRSRQAKR